MLRCYDCARLIPEGEAHRRTVKVGYSTGTSYRQPARFGDSGSTETYSTSHYAQVTLCTECLRAAGKNERKSQKTGHFRHFFRTLLAAGACDSFGSA